MQFISPVFKKNGIIPEKYSCDKEGNNPPFEIFDIPKDAKSLALLGEDPDTNGNWVFWLVWNIKPNAKTIDEGTVPSNAIEGINSWGRIGYGAICPTHGMNVHQYVFWLFALDTKLNLPPGSTKSQVEDAMRGHILEKAHTMGVFRR